MEALDHLRLRLSEDADGQQVHGTLTMRQESAAGTHMPFLTSCMPTLDPAPTRLQYVHACSVADTQCPASTVTLLLCMCTNMHTLGA